MEEFDFIELRREAIRRLCGRFDEVSLQALLWGNLLRLLPLPICKLYEEVTNRAARIGYAIELESHIDRPFCPPGPYGKSAEDDQNCKIILSLKKRFPKDKLPFVMTHELGEVDFLCRMMPSVCGWERNSWALRIPELFSHPHVMRLAEQMGIGDVELASQNSHVMALLRVDNSLKVAWQKALSISWTVISVPSLLPMKERLSGYFDVADEVDKIIGIAGSVTTFDGTSLVEASMEKVIAVLAGLGMRDVSILVRSQRAQLTGSDVNGSC